jgi:hypothetical protein
MASVNDETALNRYTGNGVTTVFPYQFTILDQADIAVFIDGAVQTLSTHYTLSGVGVQGGGNVTFLAAPANNAAVTILRDMDLNRVTDYQANGAFLEATVDSDFNRLWYAMQQFRDVITARALLAPFGEDPADLPPAASRANMIQAYDSAGDPTVVAPVSGSAADVLVQLANAADTAKGDALVAVKRDADTTAQTLHYWIKMRKRSVLEFMSTAQIDDVLSRTGALDVSTAIASALTSIAGTTGILEFPSGLYLATLASTIAANRVFLVGEGPSSTFIKFNPSATATCFNFDRGASSIDQSGIDGFGFTSDNSNTKTAIRVRDGRGCFVRNMGTVGTWSGTGSIFLHTLGRDTLTVCKVNVGCERPVVIDVNPNFATLHCDHFHFQDCELSTTATAGKVIEIVDGVNISNLTFDGYQAWTLGKYGLYWNDAASVQASYGLVISGLRPEQGTDATGHSIYLASTAQNLQQVSIRDSYLDLSRNGIFLRRALQVSLTNVYSGATSGNAIDMTFVAGSELSLDSFFCNAGSAAVLTNGVLKWASRKQLSGSPIPSQAFYSFVKDGIQFGDAVSEPAFTLTNNSVQALSSNDVMQGFLIVTTNDGNVATFRIGGAAHAVSEISDPAGVFSAAAGTATSNNVYWSAGNTRYELENKTGSTIAYKVLLIGSYAAY